MPQRKLFCGSRSQNSISVASPLGAWGAVLGSVVDRVKRDEEENESRGEVKQVRLQELGRAVCLSGVKWADVSDVREGHVGEVKGQTRKDSIHAIAGLPGALRGDWMLKVRPRASFGRARGSTGGQEDLKVPVPPCPVCVARREARGRWANPGLRSARHRRWSSGSRFRSVRCGLPRVAAESRG